MRSESLQDLVYDPLVLLLGLEVDEDVVHVDANHTFHNKVLEDVVHHRLEGRRAVCKSKKHHQGFKIQLGLLERGHGVHLTTNGAGA